MSALADTLRALASVLDARGLRWYVFGAQAVAVRAAPRATQDIDVTVELASAALDELVAELLGAELRHRYPDKAERLLVEGAVLALQHPSGMEVDLVLAGSGLETLALGRATRMPVDGIEVPVATATDLVVMKVLSGRGKDLEDLRALLAASEVDLTEARDLVAQFEDALGRSDLLVVLESAITDVGSAAD